MAFWININRLHYETNWNWAREYFKRIFDVYEIDNGRPIIAAVAIDKGTGVYLHDVLIKGYTGLSGSNMENVIFNNPEDGGNRQVLSYANFLRTNNSWAWYETLRLVTNPRQPIQTGFYDWCRIYDGGTTTITPSTISLSYTAGFGSVETPPAHPVSWSWKLVFIHTTGECIAQSWTSNSTTSPVTWNISGFSLPSGYQWYYNYDGIIPGRVELNLLDSDGVPHYDAINVTYAPTNQYPGFVIYEDNTVSSSQPEVKAHQMIMAQNDQILSGGNITCRAGDRIDIKDGITIQNGGTTNFVVDPSIR